MTKLDSQSFDPLISVCIPTRNGSKYLPYCLETVLNQGSVNIEIIIAENSDPGERLKVIDLVEKLNLDNIVLIQQESVVSMTQNFESCLNVARGKYVVFLGDDDGLVPQSLEYVSKVLTELAPAVLVSPLVFYSWPSSGAPRDSTITIPVHQPIVKVNSKSILEKVANFEMRFSCLPMIYWGLVSREIIEIVKSKQGSFFADSTSVDMYSGMVVAAHVPEFMVLDRPFTICGGSEKSNGGSLLNITKNSAPASEHNKLTRHKIDCDHHQLPDKGVLESIVLIELYRFKRNFPLEAKDIAVSHEKAFLSHCCLNRLIDKNLNDSRIVAALAKFKDADPGRDWDRVVEQLNGPGMLFQSGAFRQTEALCRSVLVTSRWFFAPNIVEAGSFIRKALDGETLFLKLSFSGKLMMWWNNITHSSLRKSMRRIRRLLEFR